MAAPSQKTRIRDSGGPRRMAPSDGALVAAGSAAEAIECNYCPATPPTLTRAERRQLFQLDAPDVVLFRNVRPGGTSKCNFTVQNVDTTGRTHTLSWGAPRGRSSRLFHIDYPLPVNLRPGNAHTVEVVFKAAASCREEAWLDFTTDAGSFRVPLLTQEAQIALEVRHVRVHQT